MAPNWDSSSCNICGEKLKVNFISLQTYVLVVKYRYKP